MLKLRFRFLCGCSAWFSVAFLLNLCSGEYVSAQVVNRDVYETCGYSFSGWLRANGIIHCFYNSDEPGWNQSVIPGKNPIARSGSGQGGSKNNGGYSRPLRSLPYPPGYTGGTRDVGIPSTAGSGGRPQDLSGNLYGPRGGCYRLNSKGNKDYSKC